MTDSTIGILGTLGGTFLGFMLSRIGIIRIHTLRVTIDPYNEASSPIRLLENIQEEETQIGYKINIHIDFLSSKVFSSALLKPNLIMKKKHSHKDKIILPFIESINGVPKFIDYININPNSCSEFHYEAYIVDDDYIKVKADVKKYNYYVKYKPWYLYRPTRVKEVYLQEKTGSNEIGCRFKYTKI